MDVLALPKAVAGPLTRPVAEPLRLARRALDDLHVIAHALDELPEMNRRLAALDGLQERLDGLDRLAVSADRLSRSTRTLSEVVVPLQRLGALVDGRIGLGGRSRSRRSAATPEAAAPAGS